MILLKETFNLKMFFQPLQIRILTKPYRYCADFKRVNPTQLKVDISDTKEDRVGKKYPEVRFQLYALNRLDTSVILLDFSNHLYTSIADLYKKNGDPAKYDIFNVRGKRLIDTIYIGNLGELSDEEKHLSEKYTKKLTQDFEFKAGTHFFVDVPENPTFFGSINLYKNAEEEG